MPVAKFIETSQYGRFKEFCDACMEDCFIGLCYGAAGVGKTRSAQVYSGCEASQLALGSHHSSVLYTAPVQNTPLQVERSIANTRAHNLSQTQLFQKVEFEMDLRIRNAKEIRKRENAEYEKIRDFTGYGSFPWSRPNDIDLIDLKRKRLDEFRDPTRLIIIDEADRLKVSSMEQVRDIYDRDGNIGLILIGMPGIERRLSRYPQLYSRVGFVHEFKPLKLTEMRDILGSLLDPNIGIDEEGIAALLRSCAGNFRLLERLLAQVKRVLEINSLSVIDSEVVSVARESLVIGSD